MQDKKYFCYEIYRNLAVWSYNGKLSYNPCSFFSRFIKTADSFDLDTVWNSPEHQHLKDLIEQDKPIPGCKACYQAEENGLPSRRTGAKQFYEIYLQDTTIESTVPTSIDYSIGNLCNLKCVICGPENSSAWLSDYRELNPQIPINKFKYEKLNQIELDDPVLLNNLRKIHFHGGGDPLLSNKHINLLNRVKNLKGLGDLHVHYNINGTTTASDELLELWGECKLVELYFSIDDVGKRFDYQRTGASWDNVTKNMQWFFNNMPVNHMFKINCTWSYLNIFYLDELFNWWQDNFQHNRLGDPVNLIFQKATGIAEVKWLSAATKQKLINKFKDYPMLLDIVNPIKESNDPHNDFLEFISRLDSIRNTKITDTFDDFAILLNR
jgi:MoaA/NifB/PqqE/SkfB family radical SAM enzyme